MAEQGREHESVPETKEELIAPCGMNCSLCIAYQFAQKDLNKHGFRKKYCPGCVPRGEHCTYMRNQCDRLGKGLVRFCFECDSFPCKSLKTLDKRYRTKYHMSMVENLEFIKEHSTAELLKREEKKWSCPECNGLICCHNGLCLNCSLDTLHQNKTYRWNESNVPSAASPQLKSDVALINKNAVRKTKPGEILSFGMYPQSEDGIKQPIRWRILQNTGNELLILSEDILDCKRYHGNSADIKWRDCVDITWQECDLRKWLNDGFFNIAFNDAEKELIKISRCKDNGEGSPDTNDKVFLLSVNEIKDLSAKHGTDWRRAIGTDFAKMKKHDGCSLYVYDKTNQDNYMIKDGKEVGCSWWWLRTQGNKPSRAYFIGTSCSIRSYANVSVSRAGVRPALKIGHI